MIEAATSRTGTRIFQRLPFLATGTSATFTVPEMLTTFRSASPVLKQEMSDLRVANARYWSRKDHNALDKSARALRQERLLQIKRELSEMRKRCA